MQQAAGTQVESGGCLHRGWKGVVITVGDSLLQGI
jgi:hypothetical protein